MNRRLGELDIFLICSWTPADYKTVQCTCMCCVMYSELASSAIDHRSDRVKPKTIILVFAVLLQSIPHKLKENVT